MPTLPEPGDYPDAAVVIYDGQCQFCSQQVRRLAGLDGKNRLSFLSLHDPLVKTRFPALSHEELMEAMYLVEPSGRAYRGAAAFRVLTRRIPWLWPLMPILHLPFSLPLWQAIYRFIARRRSRIKCDDGTCQIHLRK